MSPTPPTLLEEYRSRLAIPSHREGGPNDIKDEMPYLLGRAEGYQRFQGLEVGVRSGNSTAGFLAAAARVRGHLWSIDIRDPEVPAWWHDCGYWTFTRAASTDDLPDLVRPYDFVFLDGDHSEQVVLAELRKWVPLVKPGGVVMVHDTNLTDPVLAGQVPGVTAALDTFCAETGREWAERGGQFGLGVIEAPNG